MFNIKSITGAVVSAYTKVVTTIKGMFAGHSVSPSETPSHFSQQRPSHTAPVSIQRREASPSAPEATLGIKDNPQEEGHNFDKQSYREFEELTGFTEPVSDKNHPIPPRILTPERQQSVNASANTLEDTSIRKTPTTFSPQKIISEYDTHGSLFKEACAEYNVNPKKHLTMNSLKVLHDSLAQLTNAHQNEHDLRQACEDTMQAFLTEKTQRTRITHNKKAPNPYRLPPYLEPHDNVDPGTDPSAYYFRFDGALPVSANPHELHSQVLEQLAHDWKPDSQLPELPALDIEQEVIDEEMPENCAVYTVDTLPETPEILAARKKLLLNTSICTGNVRPDDINDPLNAYARFETMITHTWDIVCRNMAKAASPPIIDANEHRAILHQNRLIENALKQLEAKESTPPEVTQYLYLCLALLNKYIGIGSIRA